MIDPKLLKKLNKDGWTQDGDVFRRGEEESTIPVTRMASGRYNEDRLPTNRRRKKQRSQAARRERRKEQRADQERKRKIAEAQANAA